MAKQTKVETQAKEVKVTKVDIAREVFAEVNSDQYELPEGKSLRAMFMELVMKRADLTTNGAATYWQNLRRQAAGGPMYITAKKTEKAESETEAVADDAKAVLEDVQAESAEDEQAKLDKLKAELAG